VHLPVQQCHLAIGQDTAADLVVFAHAALFSPTLSTSAKALQCQHIPKFAGLTLACLWHFLPISMAMHQGHMDQSHQNQCSTKHANTKDLSECYPDPMPNGHWSYACFAAIMEPLGQIYMDQPASFQSPPALATTIMVLYDHDSNAILMEPFKDHSTKTILTAFKVFHMQLCQARL